LPIKILKNTFFDVLFACQVSLTIRPERLSGLKVYKPA